MVDGPQGTSPCSASHLEPAGWPVSRWLSTTFRRTNACLAEMSTPPILARAVQETARDVDIWHVDLRQPRDWVEKATALLAPDEREGAARGTPDVRRRRVV